MLKFVELKPVELDKYVFKAHPEANFLQTSAWGKVYEIDEEQVFYRGVEKDGKVRYSIGIRIRKLSSFSLRKFASWL